ncbi:FecR domain-containing protein [Herbaspirillum lusitanum]|uniref:FecR domain-containing protein n=1 Tax=Herbaspirillum lusitanum TaxID=213312 RepID=A0ABW9AAY4_9BURK
MLFPVSHGADDAIEPGGDALDAALNWFVTLSSGEVSAQERREFEQWLAQPGNQQHWGLIEQFQHALRGVPGPVAGQALRKTRQPVMSRRMALGVLGGIAAGALLYTQRDSLLEMNADQRTATGEQKTITLADGTQVMLDTHTALDIRFDGQQRRIILRRGAIMIETAHQPGWADQPFIVQTTQGEVRALGTRFTVREEDPSRSANRRVLVAVMEGAVEISPGARANSARLKAGQQTGFSASRIDAPAPLDLNAQAWAQGMLVARSRTLGDFLQELGRYRPGILNCDGEVAEMRVTGVFPLDDTDRILNALAQAFPLRIKRRTRYWVNVAAR